MRRPVIRLALVAAILFVVGCDGIFGTKVCTTQFVYGVRVDAVHAADGTPVEVSLTGTLVGDSYTEEMEVFGNQLLGAGERPGLYEVTVTAEGFEPWTRVAWVRHDGCHVITQRFTAELVPVG